MHTVLCCFLYFPLSPGLWGLVNNGGISGLLAPNEWLTKQDFVTVLDMNLLGMIEVTLSLLPLVSMARGCVVNMSSVMGRLSFLGGGYFISKYGIEAFSDSLRRELAPFGVKVTVIEPGSFKTNMNDMERLLRQVQEGWDRARPKIKEVYGEKFLASCELTTIGTTVMDCMEHALTACHPHTRYLAGWDAKLFYLPMSYMPTFLADAILTWVLPRPAKAL
uniref:Retinol dehydrogenase 16 n=1 Tax=Prolemur simus TaxID=1328070 RepID=A0A8C9AQB2_PROSS